MDTTKKALIGLGIVLLIAVILLVLFYDRYNRTSQMSEEPVPTENALDVTIDFYNAWLADALSTTTDPITSGLINSPRLSEAVRAKITATSTNGLDPVFCQPTPPERLGGREVFTLPREAQVAVLARGLEERALNQALVTLTAVSGSWQISDITCTLGEVGPEREYDFEQSGYLLKSVLPPLDPQYWHLVFEQNGVPGHTVPLFFSPESICISGSGNESVCAPEQFVEPTKVYVQADMLEAGAQVKRVIFEN